MRTYSTLWSCQHCGQQYSCVNGIPRLYIESVVGAKDKELRDKFYNGLLGTYYQHAMPFLSLPARPGKAYWKGWLVYVLISLSLISIVGYLIYILLSHGLASPTFAQLALLLIVATVGLFFFKHSYLFYLMILAVPVKISLLANRFRPVASFAEIHNNVLRNFLESKETVQVLDISTGTCNSLYRHGWMKLNAEYTGLDLSQTMLVQGQKLMAERQVPIDLVLGDSMHLPLQSERFDIVLNYGALNGFTNPKLALEEMARVTKKGGLLLFLDEQLYDEATFVERIYFNKVLSSHNVIHSCPREWIPDCVKDIAVYQVYQFYYLCTAYKR